MDNATPAAAPATVRLDALTSLRFFAAAAIVLAHSEGLFGIPQGITDPFNLGQAVSFFFVLSGFILAWVYPTLDAAGVKSFYVARFARVWPAHIATLLLVFILLAPHEQYLHENARWWMLVSNLTLTHAWIPYKACCYHYNTVSWSVSTEAFFYVCFPLLIHKFRQTWRLKLLLAAGLTAGMITFCNVAHIRDGMDAVINRVSVHVLIYDYPVTRMFEFVLGMTMSLLFQALRPRINLGKAAGTGVEITTVALMVVLMYYSGRMASEVQRVFPSVGEPGVLWLFPSGICAPMFGCLIVVMALNRGLVSRFLSLPFIVLGGEISYSIYLLHLPLLMYYQLHQARLAWIPNPVKLVMFWSLVLAGSYLMWRYVERPCREFIRAYGERKINPQAKARAARFQWRLSAPDAAVLLVLLALLLPVCLSIHR